MYNQYTEQLFRDFEQMQERNHRMGEALAEISGAPWYVPAFVLRKKARDKLKELYEPKFDFAIWDLLNSVEGD